MIKKVIIIIFLVVIGIYLLAAISFHVMNQIIFKQNPEKRFREAGIKPDTISYTWQGMTLAGISVGADSLPLVVFVHGSPGSWTDYLDNLTDTQLISKVHLIAVDRIGYGQSNHAVVTSLQEHAVAFAEMVRSKYPGRKAIWVGHSYGGPIVARVAMDNPDVVSSLIIVAGSIDPAMEKNLWYNRAASWKAVQWILPGVFVTSNKEIVALKKELDDMLPFWKNITVLVSFIQGTTDNLVPPENVAFAKRSLTNSRKLEIQMIEKQGHLIPWQKPEAIKNSILKSIGHSDVQ